MSSAGSDRAMNSEFFAMAMKVKSDSHLQYSRAIITEVKQNGCNVCHKQYELELCKGSKSPEGNKTEREWEVKTVREFAKELTS